MAQSTFCVRMDENLSAMLSSHGDATTVRVVEKLFTGEIIPLYSIVIVRSD